MKSIAGVFFLMLNLTLYGQDLGSVVFRNARLIDGNGGSPIEQTDILVKEGRVAAIGPRLQAAGIQEIDLRAKTMMPALISSHVHVGVINGNSSSGTYFTEDNIIRQLKKYQDYGVTNILTMGTDRPLLFDRAIRDRSALGSLRGARYHSAGYGFNVPDAGVDSSSFLGNLYRPATVAEAEAMTADVLKLKPEVIKIWVDGPPATKMRPDIYRTIISHASGAGIRTAAHVFYLSDARNLIKSGIAIFAHSVRDSVIDDHTVQEMKSRQVAYIPTLSLDKYASAYVEKPDWLADDFFKVSLEPGVFEMLASKEYSFQQKASPSAKRAADAHRIALQNVKKLHDAGVLVALGSDSGSFPYRPQGFSEHLELQLLVEAGLSPLQAITVATRNAARVLQIDKEFGSIEVGKVADLIILDQNPARDIKNTKTISAVYKAGLEVSKGPLQR